MPFLFVKTSRLSYYNLSKLKLTGYFYDVMENTTTTPTPLNVVNGDSMVDDLSTTTRASPPSPSPIRPPCAIVARILTGRYTFPEADPSSTVNWTMAKWKQSLSLTPFDYTDEPALEIWADTQTSRISGSAPSLRTFLSVLTVEADPAIDSVFQEIASLTTIRTLEDIIDAFATRWFPDSHCAGQLEAKFYTIPRCESFSEAHSTLLRHVRVYSYIAQRRGKENFITEPLLSDALLRCIPKVVRNRVLDKEPPFLTFSAALVACKRAEATLKLKHGGVLPTLTTPVSYAAATPRSSTAVVPEQVGR